MSAFIISDRPAIATHLRRVLLAQGRDCPITNVLPSDQVKRLSIADSIAVLFIVIPGDQELAPPLIRQARALTAARIVCVGIPHEPRAILEALHSGADDYVDESDDLEVQVTEVLMRIEAVRRQAKPSGSLINVTSCSGGSGCTTIASNLAISLARRFQSCGLVDVATEHGEINDHFNIKPRHTLGDLLRSVDSLDAEVVAQSLAPHDSGVAVLAGGMTQSELEESAPADLERVLHLMRAVRPYSVIDSCRRSTRRFRLAQLADVNILVVRLDFPSLCSARRLVDEWQELQIDQSRIVLVANRCGQVAEIPATKADPFLRRSVDVTLVDDAMHANVSVNCGVPLMIEAPKCKLAMQIEGLAHRIAPGSVEVPATQSKTESAASSIYSLFRKKATASA